MKKGQNTPKLRVMDLEERLDKDLERIARRNRIKDELDSDDLFFVANTVEIDAHFDLIEELERLEEQGLDDPVLIAVHYNRYYAKISSTNSKNSHAAMIDLSRELKELKRFLALSLTAVLVMLIFIITLLT